MKVREHPNLATDVFQKYNFDLIKKTAVTEEDKEIFGKIDEIVDKLQENFKELNKEFIIDSLKSNSLNLKNTYSYLQNPSEMKGSIC